MKTALVSLTKMKIDKTAKIMDYANIKRRYFFAAPKKDGEEDVEYFYDPDGKNKPEGSGWTRTDKGWTTSKPETKKEKKTERVKREKAESLQVEASAAVKNHYGNIDPQEKQRAEKETRDMIYDYIKNVSKGEKAYLPPLSKEAGFRFLQATFMLIKAKDIDGISTSNKQIKKQKDQIVDHLTETAENGLNSVIEELAHTRLTKKIIKPSTAEEFAKSFSDKPVDQQDPEEYSDGLSKEKSKNYRKEFLKRPEFRGKDYKDVPQNIKEKSDLVAFHNNTYGSTFLRMHWGLKDSIKYRSKKKENEFIFDGYSEKDSAVVSDVSLPVETLRVGDMSKTMDIIMKKLVAIGFNGKLQTDKDAESVALNKGNIRVVSDDAKMTAVANDIIKESFEENGIPVKTETRKNQFGMDEADLLDYRTRLKYKVRNNPKGFVLPVDDLPRYMAAARFSGLDLVVGKNNRFRLIPHDPDSEVGKAELDAKDKRHPKEILLDIWQRMKSDSASVKKDPDPIDFKDEYEGLKKTKKPLDDEPDFSVLDEEESEAEDARPSSPAFDADSVGEQVASVSEKIKNKDKEVFPDVDVIVSGMLNDLENGRNERLYGSYERGMQKMLVELMGAGLNTKIPSKTGEKIEKLTKGLKEYKKPSEPKTGAEIGIPANASKTDVPEDYDKGDDVIGKDGLPCGWIYGKHSGKHAIFTADGKHGIMFDDMVAAKSFARKNPYMGEDVPVYVDPADKYHKEIVSNAEFRNGNVWDTSKKVNPSAAKTIIDKYGISDDENTLSQLLGYKRYVLSSLTPEERKAAKTGGDGIAGVLNARGGKKLMTQFLSAFKEGGKTSKTAIAKMNHNDFIKILKGISVSR